MTHPGSNPEQNNPLDATAAFQQIFNHLETATDRARAATLDFVQSEPALNERLQFYLTDEDVDVDTAMALAVTDQQLSPDEEEALVDRLQNAVDAHNAAADAEAASAMSSVGIGRIDEQVRFSQLEVEDPHKFAAALRQVRQPSDPEEAAHLRENLTNITSELLHAASLAAEQRAPATPNIAPAPPANEGLADIPDFQREHVQGLRDAVTPSPAYLDAVIAASANLAEGIDNAGLPPEHSRGFRSLQAAAQDGAIHEWSLAKEVGLFDSTQPGDIHTFEGRFTTTEECDNVVAVVSHINEVLPGTTFAQGVTDAILEDINTGITTPFDPDADPQFQINVDSHDEERGREVHHEINFDDVTMENLMEDFVENPPHTEPEWASPEDSRRINQEMHAEQMAILHKMRRDLLNTMPTEERERFIQSQTAESVGAAAIGNVIQVISAQEAILEGTLANLENVRTLFTGAQELLQAAIAESRSSHADAAVSALTEALGRLSGTAAHIQGSIDNLGRYNP